MFDFKSILFYVALFIATLFANYLFNSSHSDALIDEVAGDFSTLGVSDSVPIVTYTATWCDACKNLKTYLLKNNIKYKNIDVDQDDTAMKRLSEWGIVGIPVVIVKGNLVQGFNKQLLDKYLLLDD
jgi:glutaredoxin